MPWLHRIDRAIEAVIGVMQWLGLPLVALLFLQWPLRDLLRAYSREANDLAQCIFALYVAASMTAATRAGTHLAADLIAQHYSARTRDILARIAAVIGLLPWALFLLISSRNIVIESVLQREAFADSDNPGYFLIKLALWLLALLVLAQGIVTLLRPRSGVP
ncbi:MAG TPA: TRAP transporter small permease subunit [Pseudolabrys sp.]|nr:TRAP transporter small permease subunit [Pseudolabrys sp.]